VSNAADAVAILLLHYGKRHRHTFTQLEGTQLMCKLFEAKGCGMLSAVRILSFAVQDQLSCQVLVDSGALKNIFRWWKLEGYVLLPCACVTCFNFAFLGGPRK
jgi:hypothetical protein